MSEITELKGLVTKLLPVKLLVNNEGQIEGVPKNPRFIKDWRYKLLLQSLTESPEMLSLKELWVYKVGNIYVVIAGNMRLRGSKEKGYKSLPCKILPPETSVEKLKEYAIKDNSGYGDWEMDSLANEWESPKIVEWGVELNGWENGDEPFEESETAEAKEDDFDTTPPAVAKTVLGDLYEIGEHRVICGDSTDSDAVARLMNGHKADMVFTDPPYGVDYKGINNDNRSGLKDLLNGAFKNYILNSKNGASIYCFHSDKCADIFNEVFRSFCHFSSMIIWVKESIVLSQTDYQSKHEPCLYGWFDNGTHKWYSDRKQESVWIAKSKIEEGHTTPKPIEIVSKGINNSSETNHLVLDLFLGSGSTMVAAHQLNRKCYGMELEPKYVDVTIKRMLNLDSTLRVKRNGVDVTEEWRA